MSSRTRLVPHSPTTLEAKALYSPRYKLRLFPLSPHPLQPPQPLITSLPFEPNLHAFRPLLSPLISVARGSMALFKIMSFAFLTLATSAMFSTMAGAVRQFNKRSNLDMVPPISESGYTLPLEGGWTYQDSPNCPISSPQLYLHPKANLYQVSTPFPLPLPTNPPSPSPSPAATCPTNAVPARLIAPPS
jgi:hypothetical protein